GYRSHRSGADSGPSRIARCCDQRYGSRVRARGKESTYHRVDAGRSTLRPCRRPTLARRPWRLAWPRSVDVDLESQSRGYNSRVMADDLPVTRADLYARLRAVEALQDLMLLILSTTKPLDNLLDQFGATETQAR